MTKPRLLDLFCCEGGYGFAADAARQALQMPWASRDGCAEAIPPAYTRFIGLQLMRHLTAATAS